MLCKKVALQSSTDLILKEVILLRLIKQSKTVLSGKIPICYSNCEDNRFFSAQAK